MCEILLQTNIPEFPVERGKVRDVIDLGDYLLLVTTDRVSAFDRVLLDGIPGKGEILTEMSNFWLNFTRDIVPNHLITVETREIINRFPKLSRYCDQLEKRSMLVRKARPLKVECIVRGYITGSGWKDYQRTGMICGIPLPAGLLESEKLPETLFTPSSKVKLGHDENISLERAVEILGEDVANKVKGASLAVYERACAYAVSQGIIIADTKFEFGVMPDGTLSLIDEVLTPDSSRFWPVEGYKPGGSQMSFDKQYIRDYLKSINWDGNTPAPTLPKEIIEGTVRKYREIRDRLLTE